jgi:hypothetical protein
VWFVLLLGVLAIAALVAVQWRHASGEEQRRQRLALDALREVTVVGALQARALREASGITPSAQQADLFWSINDSGHEAALFALTGAGEDLGQVRITGARNRDWEAIASGACGNDRCLYIGDVGDNLARHRTVTIWRVREPAAPGRDQQRATPVLDSLVLRYPDGPRDVEAMWVDGMGDLWFATKRRLQAPDGRARQALVYRVPVSAWQVRGPVVATLVDSLPHVVTKAERTMITDAAWRPPAASDSAAGEGRLAIRTYGYVFVFATTATGGRPGRLLATCDLRPLDERQGEGIAWRPDGRLLFASEGRGTPLQAGRCP